jgi:zinc transport system substrate-binding protein
VRRRRPIGRSAAGLAVLVLAGCGPAAAPATPLVVATFYPLYEFSRRVAGDRAEVVSLVPPGVEPHDWDPSPADLVRIAKARVLVYNGAGFEPWVDRVLRDPVAGQVVVNATAGLPLVPPDLPGHGDPPATRPPAADRRGGGVDPHVWVDPLLAIQQVENIRAGLEKADPAGAGRYAENAAAYRARLVALHEAFERGLRECRRRDLMVSHAAFGYLARRYRLAVVPVMGLAPEAEPSPAQLAAIVRFARRQQVRYIFFETLVSPRLAETLAREVGARTLVLNPVEGLSREEQAAGVDYVALMDGNLRNLRIGLECR